MAITPKCQQVEKSSELSSSFLIDYQTYVSMNSRDFTFVYYERNARMVMFQQTRPIIWLRCYFIYQLNFNYFRWRRFSSFNLSINDLCFDCCMAPLNCQLILFKVIYFGENTKGQQITMYILAR